MAQTDSPPVSPASPAKTLNPQQRLEALFAANGLEVTTPTTAPSGAAGESGSSSKVAGDDGSIPNGAALVKSVSELADIAPERIEAARDLVAKIMAEAREGKGVPRFPKTRLRHQHMIAYMLANPFASVNDMAEFFGVSRMTLNRLMSSDTFKALVVQHRIMLETDFAKEIFADLRETLALSMEVVQENLVTKRDGDFALSALKETGKLMGMGQSGKGPVINNNINVVTAEMLAAARQARQQNLPAPAYAALPPSA